MGKYVDIEVDYGIKRALGPVQAARRRAILKEVLGDWANHATTAQRIYAPIGETGYLHRHIGQTSGYSPGGSGGGGEYKVIAGVKRGVSDHPLYVHFGTANPEGTSVRGMAVGGTGSKQGRIYPKAGRTATIYIPDELRKPGGSEEFRAQQRQPALAFQKKGETKRRFRAWVSGQAPKPFVYYSFLTTSVYAKGQLNSVVRDLFTQ